MQDSGGGVMSPSQACLDLIKRFEGCVLTAYPDPGTGGDPWTIGVGHTGPEVHKGLTISQDIADAYLLKDVTHAADAVRRLVTVPMTQGQFDALCSFVFNCGADNFEKSTLRKKMNAGDVQGASLELLKWTRAAGKELKGLVLRRQAERELFLS